MFRSKLGTVVRITRDLPTYQEMTVHVDGVEAKAIAYPQLTGAVRVGDRVWLNTTAVDLNLGTGVFILSTESRAPGQRVHAAGAHYEAALYPWQVAVAAVEEEGSEAHERIRALPRWRGRR